MKALPALLLLLSVSYSATHNGDGAFDLFPGQSIESHTHYVVELSAVGPSPGLGAGQARLGIYGPDGTPAGSAVLDSGGTYNATFPGDGGRITGRVLSIRLYWTGYALTQDGANSSYARVKVSSADFGTPAPLMITSVSISPRKYDAIISWETNDGANGTAYVYGSPSSRLVNLSTDPASAESHALRVGGLEPDSAYTVVVEACDLSCVSSAPQDMRTFGGENRTGGAGNEPSNQDGSENKNAQNGASSVSDGLVFAGAAGAPSLPRELPFIAVGALSVMAILLLRR